MNKKFAIIIIAMAFVAASCDQDPKYQPSAVENHPHVVIGNTFIHVEVVNNDYTRAQGLSGRDPLADDSGMLFIFDTKAKHSFWMKDMKFELDMIWIADGKVMEVTSNVPNEPNVADKDLKIYVPTVPVDHVLEVNAGFAAKNKIKVGDTVNLTTD